MNNHNIINPHRKPDDWYLKYYFEIPERIIYGNSIEWTESKRKECMQQLSEYDLLYDERLQLFERINRQLDKSNIKSLIKIERNAKNRDKYIEENYIDEEVVKKINYIIKIDEDREVIRNHVPSEENESRIDYKIGTRSISYSKEFIKKIMDNESFLKDEQYKERFKEIYEKLKEFHDEFKKIHQEEELENAKELSDIPDDIFNGFPGYLDMTKYNHELSHIFWKYNSFEGNKRLLDRCKREILSLRTQVKEENLDLYEIEGWERCVLCDKILIEKCYEILSEGYLVTYQLATLRNNIDNYIYDEKQAAKTFRPLIRIYDDDIYHLLELNVKWKNVKRDLQIFSKSKINSLDEITKTYNNLKKPAISNIIRKVQEEYDLYKFRIFEEKYFDFLKSLKKFKPVEWHHKNSNSTISAYDFKNDNLYLFSLMNAKFEQDNYIIDNMNLKSIIDYALNNLMKYNYVFMKAVIFDIKTERITIHDIKLKEN